MLNLGRFWEMYEPGKAGVVGTELELLFTMIDLELRRSHPPPLALLTPIEWGEGGRKQGKIVGGKRVPVGKSLKQLIVGADGFVDDSVRLEVMRLHSLYEECLHVLYVLVPDTSAAHYNIQQAMKEASGIDFNLFKWNHVCSGFAEAEQARKFQENSRAVSQLMLDRKGFSDAQIVRFLFSTYRRARLDEWQKKEYFQQSFTNIFGNNRRLVDRLNAFFFSAETLPYECILAKVIALLPSNQTAAATANPKSNSIIAAEHVKNGGVTLTSTNDSHSPSFGNDKASPQNESNQLQQSATSSIEAQERSTSSSQKSDQAVPEKNATPSSHKPRPKPMRQPKPTPGRKPSTTSTMDSTNPNSSPNSPSPGRKRPADAEESGGNSVSSTRTRPLLVCKYGLNKPDGRCSRRNCPFKHMPRHRYAAEVCEIRRCDMSCGKIYHNPFSNLRMRSTSPPAKRQRSSEYSSNNSRSSRGNKPSGREGAGPRRSSVPSAKPTPLERFGDSRRPQSRPSRPSRAPSRNALIESITKSVMKQFEKKIKSEEIDLGKGLSTGR